MNPTEQIAALENRIQKMEDLLDQLSRTNSIPSEIEDAFAERLGTALSLQATSTGTATTPSVYAALPVTVPANPSGTLKVTYKGLPYELLCK